MNILVIVLAGLLPTYLLRFSIAGIPTNAFEVAVWIVCISSLCSTKMRRQLVDAIRAIPKKYLLWMFLFLLAAILSTLHSPDVRSSLGILKGWVITPMVFGLLVSAARRGDRDDVSGQIVHSLVLSGLVVALLGVSQIHGLNRITSIYDVPNSFALFLVPVCTIAAWVGIREKNRQYQLVSLCMLVAIVFTQSFGALVAIIGTMMIVVIPDLLRPAKLSSVVGIGHPRRQLAEPYLDSRIRGNDKPIIFRYVITLIFLILTASIFLFSGRFEYLIRPLSDPNATNSATVRLQLWDIGISLIQKNPIFGIGLGQFELAYQAELHRRFEQQANEAKSYKLQAEYVFRDPHNWIISFWLNLGAIGLFAFAYLNYSAIKAGLAGGGVYRQAIALALISMLIFGLFDTIYWKNDLSALWWLLLLFTLPGPERM